MPEQLLERPSHVPQNLYRDFDYTHVSGTDTDPHLAWKSLFENGPDIIWTPHWGGHWLLTRADTVEEVQKDWQHFSHKMFSLPKGVREQKFLPLELDPPEHTPYRHLINPMLSPRVVQRLGQEARVVAIDLIEALYPKGHCDFIADFAQQLPIKIFMSMADLPAKDQSMLLAWVDDFAHGDTRERQHRGFANSIEYLNKIIDERLKNPGTDVFSVLVNSQINGRALTPAERISLMVLLFFGGLDTVASSLGFFAVFLAQHPAHRRQLIERPELIPNAAEELFRRFGLSNTTRVVTEDYVFHGVQMKKDDVVMVPIALHGLDERRWPDPMRVDFERPDLNGHAGFGNGPHRCPGSNLARTEARIFLEEWLRRIPDFEITSGEKPRTKSANMNAVDYLPLSWKVVPREPKSSGSNL